jgi:hypothetical protein
MAERGNGMAERGEARYHSFSQEMSRNGGARRGKARFTLLYSSVRHGMTKKEVKV